MDFSVIFNQVGVLAVVMLLGFVAVKAGYVEANVKDAISSLIVKLLLPCLIIYSISSKEISSDFLGDVLIAVLISLFCILTLFLNCGLRLAELVTLNLQDIHDDNTITVTGKGDKERKIYLNSSCVAALNNYLKVRPVDGVKDRNAVFISRNKQRISRRSVQNIVETALDKSGLSNLGFSTHKLRHTAATLMYQYGDVDVLLLKEILGHENLSTTQIYTHVADEQLKNAVNLNPLNGFAESTED